MWVGGVGVVPCLGGSLWVVLWWGSDVVALYVVAVFRAQGVPPPLSVRVRFLGINAI